MPRLMKIEVLQIAIPLRFQYSHARANHKNVQSVICRVTDEAGTTGVGEAVPREYVTGETCESVRYSIGVIGRAFLHRDLELREFTDTILTMAEATGDCFPSCAYCAFEGAVLDLIGKASSRSLASLFAAEGRNPLVYSGSIGMNKLPLLAVKALIYRSIGFRHYKIKVGNDRDFDRIRHIRRLFGKRATFFADANGAWEKEDALRNIEKLAALGIEAIEEPLRFQLSNELVAKQHAREHTLDDRHYQQYRWLRERSPIPIIADESCISLRTLRKILETESFDIVNVRLSKCGGFTIASRMVKQIESANMAYGIGAMVAETPVLANEGAHFGYVHKGHRYIQGFSHKALHKVCFAGGGADLTSGARLMVNPDVPGTGLTVDEKILETTIQLREVIE